MKQTKQKLATTMHPQSFTSTFYVLLRSIYEYSLDGIIFHVRGHITVT